MKKLSAGLEDDVSMAREWNLTLDIHETTNITLFMSESEPALVLWVYFLTLSDPNSNHSRYLSSTLEIKGVDTSTSEPSRNYLMSIGLVGLLVSHREYKSV